MRRLFQLGAVMMLIGALYPLLEIFDRWDAPGFSNDTEFHVYALLLAVCFVLLLCKLISSGALRLGQIFLYVFLHDDVGKESADSNDSPISASPPRTPIPLRI